MKILSIVSMTLTSCAAATVVGVAVAAYRLVLGVCDGVEKSEDVGQRKSRRTIQ